MTKQELESKIEDLKDAITLINNKHRESTERDAETYRANLETLDEAVIQLHRSQYIEIENRLLLEAYRDGTIRSMAIKAGVE